MTYSLTNALTEESPPPISIMIRVEGVGEYDSGGGDKDGWHAICLAVPSYGDDTYKVYLSEQDLPDFLEELADPDSGLPEAGEIQFGVINGDSYWVGKVRTGKAPVGYLTESIVAADTSFNVSNPAVWTTGSKLYVDGECLFVTSGGSNPITTQRAKLGTKAVSHPENALCYDELPYLHGRKVSFYLVPDDGAASDEEEIQPSFVVDGQELDDDWMTYLVTGRSQISLLEGDVPKKLIESEVVSFGDNGEIFIGTFWESGLVEHWSDAPCWIDVGGMLCVATDRGLITKYGLKGTAVKEVTVSQKVSQIQIVDETEGSFRVSFGSLFGGATSTSRTSGTWTTVTNPIWVMLCVLCSSPDGDDDTFVLNNYSSTYGNFAALLPGFGFGWPVDEIDLASWATAAEQVSEIRLDYFWFGQDQKSFSGLFGELLKFLRAMIFFKAGKLAIVLDRIPTSADVDAAELWDSSVWARIRDRNGQDKPAIRWSQASDRHYGALKIKGKSVDGNSITRLYDSATYKQTYGVNRFQRNIEILDLEVPYLRFGDGRSDAMLERIAARFLYRLKRPPDMLEIRTILREWDSVPGDLKRLTCKGLPDFAAGNNDWTEQAIRLLGRKIDVEQNLEITFKALAYNTGLRVRKLPPALETNGAATSLGGGEYRITVQANRYCLPGVQSVGDADIDHFVVGDVLKLVNPKGDSAGGTVQTIIAINIGTPSVDLDGNFGGNLADNLILIHANFDDASAGQKTDWAWLSDKTDRTIDSSSSAPIQYAE